MPLLLNSFTSFIEVTVGINLLYSVWRDIKLRALQSYQTQVESECKKLSLTYNLDQEKKKQKEPEFSCVDFAKTRMANKIKEKEEQSVQGLHRLATRAMFSSLSVVVILLMLLLVNAFSPEMTLNLFSALLISILPLVIPFGFFLFARYKSQSSAKETIGIINNYIDSCSDMAGELNDLEQQLEEV